MGPVKVGVVDSGFALRQSRLIKDSAAFVLQDDALWQVESSTDQLEHGTRIADVIHHHAPEAELFIAQVFAERFTTTALQVAAAIRWLVEQEVQVINLSLGLSTNRDNLKMAVSEAVEAGILICASSPAKGDPVYPSAYTGVLRTTGDARCAMNEWSLLNTRFADFGAHVRCLQNGIAGASIGTAYMSGHIARFLSHNPAASRTDLGDYLKNNARYFGAECRAADKEGQCHE